jgi:frataxin-like iron-binding protein CyaY
LAKREELILQFESLLPFKELNSGKRSFRDLMDQWQKIGMTDRNKRAALDDRLAKVEDALDTLEQEHYRRTDPTAIARANDVVQGLIDAIENYENQAKKADVAGDAKKATVAREAAAARRIWLAEAQKGLTEFKKA